MTIKDFMVSSVSELQNAKENICISIILPTHRLSPERQTDKTNVIKALDKAKELLLYKYPDGEITSILGSMDELLDSIDFMHNMEGLGLYISSNRRTYIQFPFPVQEKIVVGSAFELRELIYKESYAKPYYILLLSKKEVHLFKGSRTAVFEIKNSNFPISYTDDYLYTKPAISSSYAGYAHVKNYEKDKSELESIRRRDFFRKVDKNLDNYLNDDMPMLVMGAKKELSMFIEVSNHSENIIDKIMGNYIRYTPSQLADIAWPSMRIYLENKLKILVQEFEEKIGEGVGLSGIHDIWVAANEGKAYKLLVEKDYHQPGFTVENTNYLYLHPPKNTGKLITDAVNEIIRVVLNKNGHVYLVDNGILKSYGRIALISRY